MMLAATPQLVYRCGIRQQLIVKKNITRRVHQQGTILPRIIGSIADACQAKALALCYHVMITLHDSQRMDEVFHARHTSLTVIYHSRYITVPSHAPSHA